MPADLPSPLDDTQPATEDLQAELEDLATLDVDATAEEVMTAVHWIEAHTVGAGHDAHLPSPSSIAPIPAKRVRRRASVSAPLAT